ncbi:hypothetical protein WJ73_19495 [Burkholderia ubonensis]|nr:hypothetical protein WJ73_19495 [Burkholderia ubonensis]
MAALREKLARAEQKYGYRDGWLARYWMNECRAKMYHHITKGDPLDVMAYCLFLWHHDEPTCNPGFRVELLRENDVVLDRRDLFDFTRTEIMAALQDGRSLMHSELVAGWYFAEASTRADALLTKLNFPQISADDMPWMHRRMVSIPHPSDLELRIIGFVVKNDGEISMPLTALKDIIGQTHERGARVEKTPAGPILFVNGIETRKWIGTEHNQEAEDLALFINGGKPHPARGSAEEVLDAACVTRGLEFTGTPYELLNRIVDWEVAIAIDPKVSAEAQALIARGRAEVANRARSEARAVVCGHGGEVCDYECFGKARGHCTAAVVQQPAQATARERMTHEQHGVLTRLADILEAGNAENGIANDNAEIYAMALRAVLAANPDQPIAWEATTPAYIKYITDERYQKFSPAVRKWYKPYRCSSCQPEPRGEAMDGKPRDCSGDPTSCPDNEGRGCHCSDLARTAEGQS